jgi:hypothetical protein
LRGGVQDNDVQILVEQKYAGDQASSNSVPSTDSGCMLQFSGQAEHPLVNPEDQVRLCCGVAAAAEGCLT